MGKFRSSYFNRKFLQFGNQVNVVLTGKWLFICVLVGVVAGLSAYALAFALEETMHFSLTRLAGYAFPTPAGELDAPSSFTMTQAFFVNHRWLLIVLPVIGLGFAGWITSKFAPEAKGGGVDAVIKSFHYEKGLLRLRAPFVKFIASVSTIGLGGSAGREGPIALIGGGFGSYIAEKLKLTERERKIALLAGMGAGLGAIFQSPLGGAIYSAEVLYKKDIETESLMPSIIASIVAYSVFSSISGWKTVFKFEAVRFEDPTELLWYILLSIFTTIFAIFYSRIFHWITSTFSTLKVHDLIKPLIGGLIVGLMGFMFPAVLESGYGYLQEGLNGKFPFWFLFSLAILKMIATPVTIKSGASGGVFAPSLVIGGLLGGAFGLGIDFLFPGAISDPKGFILVGMASFFAAVEKVPIATTIMVTEMSGSYELLVPLIFASAVSFIGSQSWSLYDIQLDTKLDSPSIRDEFLTETFESVKVRSAFRSIANVPIVSIGDSVPDILKMFTDSELLVLPVRNNEGKLLGLITLTDLRAFLNEADDSHFIVAADVMSPLRVLHLNDPLLNALRIFKETGLPEILVLEHSSDSKIIGVLTERNFLIASERELSERNS